MKKLPTMRLFGLLLLLLSSSVAMAQNRTITGTILDDKGETVPFASVSVVGSTTGVTTDMNGRFTLTVPQDAKTIRISFIGFKRKDVPLTSSSNYDIRLESEVTNLKEVVVVGSIERRKESFTGSYNTVSGGELKQVGSQNIVESLKSLDPSFIVLEDIAMGANPNAMPNIEVRGQTSIQSLDASDLNDMFAVDPNQPLFILDGFETTLQQIVDLDPNRVESVTIYKDAASTAFYGSRAANGVIVVETIKGQAGRFQVFYTSDWSVQIPNLSSYNLMNAAEKLEFERLSGRYTYSASGMLTNDIGVNAQHKLDSLYNARLADVESGVNSYWLSDPLRIPVTQRQSVRVTGGSEEIMLNAGIGYRNAPGVMIGSKRDSWETNLDLTYTKRRFRLMNQVSISGYTSEESPYGSFTEWTQTNPYYKKTNEDGEYERYLDNVLNNSVSGSVLTNIYNVSNPLYVAQLGSEEQTKSTTIDERIKAIIELQKDMRLEGLFQLKYTNSKYHKFTPPEHPQYDDVIASQRGQYVEQNGSALNYRGSLHYSWRNLIQKHHYSINAKAEVSSETSGYSSWRASGFPNGSNGKPSFANNYQDNGRPSYTNRVKNSANFLISGNYSFNAKYLLDATFRYDGTSLFGAAKKFQPFWSTGIGWNLHEEDFLRESKQFGFINRLRLLATVGVTGNENLANSNSSSIYSYQLGSNVFGSGVFVSELGNPYIEWQRTFVPNLAMELAMFDSRFTGKFEVYRKITSPLNVPVDQTPSSGVNSYPLSIGSLTYQGFEFDVNYALIRQSKFNWRVGVKGATTDAWYSGFDDKLAGMDAAAQNSNSLQRYRDGYHPNTIWTVRSLGIDPATGNEVFLTKDGQQTFTYNPDDVVAVGVQRPKLTGTINSYVTYKQFTFSIFLRYSLQEQIFNRALFNKVENISMNEVAYNQDRRALYDRWREPGDLSQFKAIDLVGRTANANMSSRFVQTENYVNGESISMTWRGTKKIVPFMNVIGMERLDFTLNLSGTSGIFRLSNIQRERGTSYPEAYTVSLSISTAF